MTSRKSKPPGAAGDAMIAVDESGRIDSANGAARRMFGYTPDEALGPHVGALLPSWPGGLPTTPATTTGRKKDGSEFSLEVAVGDLEIGGRRLRIAFLRAVSAEHGVGGSPSDRERREGQGVEPVRESLRVLELLFEHLPISLVLLDRDFNFIRVNESYARECGREAAEFVGLNHFDLYPSDAEEIFLEVREEKKLFQIHARPFTFPDRPELGVTYWDWTLVPILDAGGEVELLLWAIENVTEHKRLEDQLRQSQKLEAIGQLTSGIAHDFNNLLACVLTNAQLLEIDHRGDASQAEMIDAIVIAAERGATLTHSLLAFARRQTLQPKVVRLGELCEGIRGLLDRSLGETLEIELLIDEDTPTVLADPGQVESALLNLAINAKHAMPQGGKLTIGVEEAHLTSEEAADRGTRPGDFAVLSVADTGTGMPAEVLDHAFEPFFTTKDVGEGSGLGLSMVYGFAQQSGGFATLSSIEGQGTTARVYLPRASPSTREEIWAPRDDNELDGSHGETILLVEDDPGVRSATKRLLERLNYTVLVATDAANAIALLSEVGSLELLVSDVVLRGGVSGPELYEELRRARPRLKCLFISGNACEHRVDGAGATDFLAKPFSVREIAASIRGVLDS